MLRRFRCRPGRRGRVRYFPSISQLTCVNSGGVNFTIRERDFQLFGGGRTMGFHTLDIPQRGRSRRRALIVLAMVLGLADPATAQDKGSVNPKPLPPLANPDDP